MIALALDEKCDCKVDGHTTAAKEFKVRRSMEEKDPELEKLKDKLREANGG